MILTHLSSAILIVILLCINIAFDYKLVYLSSNIINVNVNLAYYEYCALLAFSIILKQYLRGYLTFDVKKNERKVFFSFIELLQS